MVRRQDQLTDLAVKERAFQGYRPQRGEEELLLRAALLRGGAAEQAWAELMPTLHLDRLSGASMRLLPLLYQNLRAFGVNGDPMPQLKGVYRRIWYKNQVALREIASLLRTLHVAGIPMLVLKDTALVVQYYRDLGLRSIDSLEVYVPRDRISSTLIALKASGWIPSSVGQDLCGPLDHNRSKVANEGALTWVVRRGVFSDVLLDALGSESCFWEGAVETYIGDVPVLTLNAADQLVHVCLDQAGFTLERPPLWAADCLMILERSRSTMDWDRVIEQAGRLRASLEMRESMTYLIEVLEAPVPGWVLPELRRMVPTKREGIAFKLSRWETKGVLGALPRSLGQYIRVTRNWGPRQMVMQFPRFLRDLWGLEHSWQVPIHAVRKGTRRIVRISR